MSQISGLFIYPIKSCGAVGLTQIEVVPGGLRHDRRYMLVEPDGSFITRRQEARLAQVLVTPKGNAFEVRAEGSSSLELRPDPDEQLLGGTHEGIVWGDRVQAREYDAGSAWFSAFLGRDVRLVYMPDEALRQVNPARSKPGDQVSFADGYPLLLTAESSLADLNARLAAPIPMSRFRPNIVVKGSPPYAEDKWRSFNLGTIPCTAPKLCDRCVVITIEEGSAKKSKEPLRTLANYRRRDGAVWFGTNVIPSGPGLLRVGDAIDITESGPTPSI